ncbi:hypothetical protein L873DRAFT_1787428 [Choiromyces venosus 120613-1]|uniref:Uncharacterized protein n=1 Tax=Choiromyces venosus 120613-1 TaxID=1336337 RepID=A0A3N4K0Z7_9PEZI|nr:hypothetical protein L873DRAFT_1787428 [Choiromyces venosus 120613-1]
MTSSDEADKISIVPAREAQGQEVGGGSLGLGSSSGPIVKAVVHKPDPRLRVDGVGERQQDVVIPTEPRAMRGNREVKDRGEGLSFRCSIRGDKGDRSTEHRARSPHNNHLSPRSPPLPAYSLPHSPARFDHYEPHPPPPWSYSGPKSLTKYGGDHWRGHSNHGQSRHSDREPRPRHRSHTIGGRRDDSRERVSHRRPPSADHSYGHRDSYYPSSDRHRPGHGHSGDSRSRRSCSPRNSKDVSRHGPHTRQPDSRKQSGGGAQDKTAGRCGDHKGSEGGIGAPHAQDKNVVRGRDRDRGGFANGKEDSGVHDLNPSRQSKAENTIRNHHISTVVSKTSSGASKGGGGNVVASDTMSSGRKPRTTANPLSNVPTKPVTTEPNSGSTAATAIVNTPSLISVSSVKGVTSKPTMSTSASEVFNTVDTAPVETLSTANPQKMAKGTPTVESTSSDSPGRIIALSATPPDSILQPSSARSNTSSSASVAPKDPPAVGLSKVSAKLAAEHVVDREMARRLFGVDPAAYDADIASRRADYDADLARRKALGHFTSQSRDARSKAQNCGVVGSESGGSSGSALNAQVHTVRDNLTSLLTERMHVDLDDATLPDSDVYISEQWCVAKADSKGKGKQKARSTTPDTDFSKGNLWPGADNFDNLGSSFLFSPPMQSGSTSFLAGAPQYHIPRGFFGSSSPSPSRLDSPSQSAFKEPASKAKYVDRGTSPDPAINCTACGPPLVISLAGFQNPLYKIHLKDSDDMAHLLFSNKPKHYFLYHVLTFPPYKSRLIHSDEMINLRNFTKIIRLGMDIHLPISQITVYLYGRDNDGHPLTWSSIPINCVDDWDGAMTVSRQWSCQTSVTIEFVAPPTPKTGSTEGAENGANGLNEAGPSI